MRYFAILMLFLATTQVGKAQLDGTGIAPDFQITDIDGNAHQLYNYLDDNKVVVLDFFAVWCSICQADASYLGEVYEEFGPAGSNKIMLLSLEADDATSDIQTRNYATDFNSSNPHINATLEVPVTYAVNYYPTYYVIAPDRSYTLIGGRQASMKELMIEAINAAPGLREVENDIRLMSFSKPKGSICETAVYPQIRVQNYGKNTVNTVNIVTSIDGEISSIYPFQEDILPYHFADISLPWLVALSSGWHEISFNFSQVNGVADGDPENGIQGGYFLVLPDGEQISVSITTDPYPKESFWRILDGDKLVAEGNGFTKGLTTESIQVCVEKDACYRLILYDTFGDGMSNGGVNIQYQNETIASIDGFEFSGDSIWVDFCVKPSSTGISYVSNDLEKITIYPNPTNGILRITTQPPGHQSPSHQATKITILNLLGETIRQINWPQSSNNIEIDLADSPAGFYFVRFENRTGSMTKRISKH